jgi:hypothetical protein
MVKNVLKLEKYFIKECIEYSTRTSFTALDTNIAVDVCEFPYMHSRLRRC